MYAARSYVLARRESQALMYSEHVRLLRYVLCIPSGVNIRIGTPVYPCSPEFLRVEVHAGYAPGRAANLALMLQARPTRGLSSIVFRSR